MEVKGDKLPDWDIPDGGGIWTLKSWRCEIYPERSRRMTCDKCNGTGLIPFVNQRGEVTPHTFLHCACHPVYGTKPAPDRYHHVSPQDIDYPVSYGHYRMLCNYHGWPDPGPDRPREPEPEKIIYRRRPVDDELDQLKGSFIHIKNVLNEHVDAAKRSAQKRTENYY